ncbi:MULTISPECIES: hypothetical protein [Microbacterium]|uniref:hypothetical protein n=1 Tax=Microbacterium TaxID=33882 RepID=UPI00278AF352|nr:MULTISPECIES: hypothetical protein [Microbacterium]MDQ1084679.1 hypothetical protein [Microbacterium sp. SORGH_AS_0344]MDQ1170044.1 hypothetical protein [Microbacterium proteolyticum]
MTGSSQPRRGRGRPRREYRIRVRAERREKPDYDKLARALLEHAAMEQAKKTPPVPEPTVDGAPVVVDEDISPPMSDTDKPDTETDGGRP